MDVTDAADTEQEEKQKIQLPAFASFASLRLCVGGYRAGLPKKKCFYGTICMGYMLLFC